MKKVTSLFLVLICCLSMSLPAFAAEPESNVRILTYDELRDLPKNGNGVVPDGCTALGEEESALFWASMTSVDENVADIDAEDNTTASTYDVRPLACATRVVAWPLALDTEAGQLFINENIYRAITFQSYDQFSSLMLTNAQTISLMNSMMTYLNNLVDTQGGSYALVGWYVGAAFYFQAPSPKSVTIAPSSLPKAPCYAFEKDDFSFSGVGTSTSGLAKAAFGYPEGKDPLKDVCNFDLSGTFSYRDNGKDFNRPFSGGLMVNKPA